MMELITDPTMIGYFEDCTENKIPDGLLEAAIRNLESPEMPRTSCVQISVNEVPNIGCTHIPCQKCIFYRVNLKQFKKDNPLLIII